MRRPRTETHRFFCPRCGEEGIPLARSVSKQRGRFHLKMLYCYHCNMTLNMVECITQEDVDIFKEMFMAGELAEIVDNSKLIDWSDIK